MRLKMLSKYDVQKYSVYKYINKYRNKIRIEWDSN